MKSIETEAKQKKDILPERSHDIIKNIQDFLIVAMLLGRPISYNKNLGDYIKSVGISRRYILNLCGRYDRKSIEKYIKALADKNGYSYDEVVDTNPDTDSREH